MIRAIVETITLSGTLFARTMGAKYRKSFLGYFWMVAPAIIVSAGACIASSSGILQPGTTTIPYPIFVFVGTLLWQSFAESATLAHQAVESSRSYLTRVYFPREAIILVQAYESILVSMVRVAVAIVFMIITGTASFYGAAMLVLCAALAVTLGIGVSLMTMPFTLLFSDLHNGIKLALGYGIFLTPALYTPSEHGIIGVFIRYNPVSPIMLAAREAIAGAPLSAPVSFQMVVVAALGLTILGVALMRISIPIVVERMLIGGR